MIGFLIGLLCGSIEFCILIRIIKAVNSGDTGRVSLLALAKLIVFGAAFVPVILFFRESILWCGVGVSLPLVFGPFINMLIQRNENSKEGTER